MYEYLRLVDGANEFEGRLEVNISGTEFGTVCNEVFLVLTVNFVYLVLLYIIIDTCSSL